jgi:O-antigen/teichoic acid export membrane protein
MSPEPRLRKRIGGIPALLLSALVVLTVLEVAFYPWVASWIYGLITGHGWDGTGLRYFQDAYVMPFGLVLGTASVITALLTFRRRPEASLTVLAAAWVVNLLALGLSIAWYANATNLDR